MNIDDKLSFFRDCIIGEADSEVAETKKQLLLQANDKLSAYSEKAKAKYKVMVESENLSTLEMKRQIHSRAHIKKTEEILKFKHQVMEEIIDDLVLKLRNFVKSPKYEKFINNMIDELLPEIAGVKNLEINFLKDEFEHDKEMFYPRFKNLDAEIKVGKFTRDKIGGIIVTDLDHQILYDLSLKSVLDSSTDEIGMIIYEEFNK